MSSEMWNEVPPEVLALRTEVEQLSGREVSLQDDDCDDLEGAMSFQWSNGDPVIFSKKYSDSGLAEELLHARLDLNGYKCAWLDQWSGYLGATVTLLNNCLQHAVIFPDLVAMGFRPDCVECDATTRMIQGYSDRFSDWADLLSHVGGGSMMAMLYVRGMRHCSRDRFESGVHEHFAKPSLEQSLAMAESVLDEISAFDLTIPHAHNTCLARCARHLQIDGQVELVDRRAKSLQDDRG